MMSIISLICGILAATVSYIPKTGDTYYIVAIIGVVLCCITAEKEGGLSGMPLAGLILSISVLI